MGAAENQHKYLNVRSLVEIAPTHFTYDYMGSEHHEGIMAYTINGPVDFYSESYLDLEHEDKFYLMEPLNSSKDDLDAEQYDVTYIFIENSTDESGSWRGACFNVRESFKTIPYSTEF